MHLQNNNLNLETSPRPSSKAPSSLSIDDNSMELRDVEPDDNMLDELEINKYLVLKKPEEEGPEIRGGHPDALLIHATKANKHGIQDLRNKFVETFGILHEVFVV